MASTVRKPLLARTQSLTVFDTSTKLRTSSKRGRSPEPPVQPVPNDTHTFKRYKTVDTASTKVDEKEKRRAEREFVWRTKYLEHFPRWTFYFDLDVLDPDVSSLRKRLEAKIRHLGAYVEDSYNEKVTHLITEQFLSSQEQPHDKENLPAKNNQLLKSPIKLHEDTRLDEEKEETSNIVYNALAAGKKIWTSEKLGNVLDRCFAGNAPPPRTAPTPPTTAKAGKRSLIKLLESERLHGTTTERDPTQKRHDYTYFSKNSYFVLIEDLKQELAPTAALEYPITRGRDGKEIGSWPVLYCHPQARGPFIEFDEKEKRRWLKAEHADKERDEEREKRKRKFRDEERERRRQSLKLAEAKSRGDLRRTVSMTNLHRNADLAGNLEQEMADLDESAKASGYLASTGGYIAASGNSVGITSTTGNTSTTSGSLTTLQLPTALRGRMQQEVITSRKFSSKGKEKGVMGPPAEIPDRRAGLRKSRSTNTMRLPKRDEGSKPGYCEGCRQRFNDFKEHITSRKHRKFAQDDANYAQLDLMLARVRRRTLQETGRSNDYEMTDHTGPESL